MRAVVYKGRGTRAWEEVPDPQLVDATDAVVRVDATTICGMDLRILSGDVEAVTPGRVLGHEAVGTVVEVGSAVRNVTVGERVLVSSITSCGTCTPCRTGRFAQCRGGGGWLLGHSIDGVQAEYARIPFADFSTYPLPESLMDEHAVQLAEVLPAGYELGACKSNVRPGDVVVVIGAGPVGLASILAAKLFSAGRIIAVDPQASRRHFAKQFGADLVVNPKEAFDAMTSFAPGGKADVVIEASGGSGAFELCSLLVRNGGRVTSVAVHGTPATVHLEWMWSEEVTLTTGLVDTSSIPTLLRLVEWEKLDASMFTTNRFALGQAMAAYDFACDADRYESLKVVMHRD
jgi:alcohol dehydrogenase